MSYLVFDSNILIDYLGGDTDALAVIDACDNPVISKIVYMEVMVGCKHSMILRTAQREDYESTLAAVESMTRNWINSTFQVMPLDDRIADLSIEVRKRTNKKLPDTIIHATALLNGWKIVTRNPADFPAMASAPAGYQNVEIIVPYIVLSSFGPSSP